MFNKKRIVNLTTDEFNAKLKYVKKYCTVIHNEEPKTPLGFRAYVNDKISKIELTMVDPDIGCKAITYVCDKSCSSRVHQKQGMEAYSTLQKYYHTPHVCDKTEALFSVAGILYHNPKYVNTRQHAYGYDMNSAFSWGMMQKMPKDTEKGPINYSKTLADYKWREVKSDEIGFGPEGELRLEGEWALYIFKAEESPYKRFVEVWYDKKKNAKTPEQKTAAKDILVMSVGFMQRHNFWMRAAIIGYCNRKIQSLINKYPDNILLSNTDSIISTCKIPELEGNLGLEVGEWKFEHDGEFAYVNSNYQWDYNTPTVRGVPKGWFKQGWDILVDPLPVNNNIYDYNKDKIALVKRGA